MTTIQTSHIPCIPRPLVEDGGLRLRTNGLPGGVLKPLGDLSSEAIKNFQFEHGLPRTGELDLMTLEVIREEALSEMECEFTQGTVGISNDEMYRNNPTTIRAQRALNEVFACDPPLQVDGIRGPATTARIEKFQELRGLEVTGKLDAETREALFESDMCVDVSAWEAPVEGEKGRVIVRRAGVILQMK